MADFADQSIVLELFKEAQKVETDNRSRASDAHSFIDDKDGQWESNFTKDDNKPRYTFDIVSSIVEQIAGEMEQADFGIKVNPAGGEATKDFAMMRNGLIRNIQNISNAKDIFNAAGRGMVTSGLDGWLVATRFIDSDSFDQDLVIGYGLTLTPGGKTNQMPNIALLSSPSARKNTRKDSPKVPSNQ